MKAEINGCVLSLLNSFLINSFIKLKRKITLGIEKQLFYIVGRQELKNHIYQEATNSLGKELVVFYKIIKKIIK